MAIRAPDGANNYGSTWPKEVADLRSPGQRGAVSGRLSGSGILELLTWFDEVFKQYFLLFPLLYHFMIKFQTRKSSNSKLPAWSRSLISSALPSMLKYVNLISGILLLYCSERARLSLNLRQRSFFACAHVFGIRISSLKQHPYRFHCELYARSTYRFHPCTFLNCLNFMPEYHRYHSWSRSLAM